MFLDWFNTKEVDEFSDSIIADLVRRLPPSGADTEARKGVERLRKTHDAIFARVEKFARSRSLNLYKKARLGNRIKWALKEAGYPADFVESLTFELVTVITLVSRERKSAAT
jgi:hypothetical protein